MKLTNHEQIGYLTFWSWINVVLEVVLEIKPTCFFVFVENVYTEYQETLRRWIKENFLTIITLFSHLKLVMQTNISTGSGTF